MGAHFVKEFLPVGLLLHVDEVDHDDAADVAQPELSPDFASCLHVGFEDRLLRVFAFPSGIAPRVHVDGHQGFRLLDDDIAALRKIDSGVEQMLDLGLDTVLVEQGYRSVPMEV